VATTDIARLLTDVLDPVAESHGFELVAVEQSGGRKAPIIRVLLDREGGVDLDAICSANAWVDQALEGISALQGPYTLEVSSPGVDRPLRKFSDFDRFAGETVVVTTRAQGESRTKWTGTLGGIDGDTVIVEANGEKFRIAYDDIVKARLKGVVSFKREGCGD